MTGKLTLFVDTNLFIQCRDVKGLPWADLGPFSEIDLIVCRPVQKEIDTHKGSPGKRIATRARNASSMLRSVLLNDLKPLALLTGSPIVRLNLRADLQGDSSVSADDQLVAIARGYRSASPDADVRVLSNDTGVLATAHTAGLPFIPVPEGWMLEPEDDRELKAAKAELERLRRSEPVFEISSDPDADPVELQYRSYRTLTDSEVEQLVDRARQRLPEATFVEQPVPKPRQPSGPAGTFDLADLVGIMPPPRQPSSEQIAQYMKDYEGWLNSLRGAIRSASRRLTDDGAAILSLSARNSGTRPATDVLVEVGRQGPLLISSPKRATDDDNTDADNREADENTVITLPRPPAVPVGRSHFDMMQRGFGGFDGLSRSSLALDYLHSMPVLDPPDPEALYFLDSDAAGVLELTRDLWRHGRDTTWFSVRLDPTRDGLTKGTVQIKIHAANLSTPATRNLTVQLTPVEIDTYDYLAALIDALEVREADSDERD